MHAPVWAAERLCFELYTRQLTICGTAVTLQRGTANAGQVELRCMSAHVHVDAKCHPARTIVASVPEWTTLIVAVEFQS